MGATFPGCVAIVASLCASPDRGVSESDAAILYREVGRLTAPLWLTGELDHIPDLTLISVQSLDATIGPVLNPERRFDGTRSEFRLPAHEEVMKLLHGELFNSLRAARGLYFADHPGGGRLPADPHARRIEEERRARERASLVERASQAIDEIVEPLFEAIGAYVSSRADEAAAQEAAAQADLVAARAAAGFARPEPQRYGVSARGAELWVADALRWLGEHDAEVTPPSSDGGVDVVSARLAVSVKHYSGTVPVEEVREIFGVAAAKGLTAALWTSGTLTETARQFADLAPVAVVHYDVETGRWSGANAAGEALLAGFDTGSERGVPPPR